MHIRLRVDLLRCRRISDHRLMCGGGVGRGSVGGSSRSISSSGGRFNGPILTDPRRFKFLSRQLLFQAHEAGLGPLCGRLGAKGGDGLVNGIDGRLAGMRKPRLLKLQAALERGNVSILLSNRNGCAALCVACIDTANRRSRSNLGLQLGQLTLAARHSGSGGDGGHIRGGGGINSRGRGVLCDGSTLGSLLLGLGVDGRIRGGGIGLGGDSLGCLGRLCGLHRLRVCRQVVENKLLAGDAAAEALNLACSTLLRREHELGSASRGLGGLSEVGTRGKCILKTLVELGSINLVLGTENLLVKAGKFGGALGILRGGGLSGRSGGRLLKEKDLASLEFSEGALMSNNRILNSSVRGSRCSFLLGSSKGEQKCKRGKRHEKFEGSHLYVSVPPANELVQKSMIQFPCTLR
eukprot:Opistho-2@58898